MNKIQLFTIYILVFFNFSFSQIQSSEPIRECNPNDQGDFKCYNGGQCLIYQLNNTESMLICNCPTGFTGRQCEQLATSQCNPDPCEPNGFCNIDLAQKNENRPNYFCRCKPGFTGVNCQENVNDCLNATCFNGGSCIDAINSYECDCKWPYIGRYCQTRLKCNNDNVCKNNGICLEDEEAGPTCICQAGFGGLDCSVKVDKCKSRPCRNQGVCINVPSSRSNSFEYLCECKHGFAGRHCQLRNVCEQERPCKNNATCISLISENEKDLTASSERARSFKMRKFSENSINYYCQCMPGFTGIDCDVKLECLGVNCESKKPQPKAKLNGLSLTLGDVNFLANTKPATKKTSRTTPKLPSTTTSKNNHSLTNNNSSFVLVVNIPPSEFRFRQSEILREFEKRLGMLILIQKEQNTSLEMIYEFHSPGNNLTTWTKVYFMPIFACVYNSPNSHNLCLQNNINDLNDARQILGELKKQSNLLPNYVSNIGYESYADALKRNDENSDDDETKRLSRSHRPETSITTILCICLAIALLIGISLSLTVIIRQQQRFIKAPIWFPPNLSKENKLEPFSYEIRGKFYEEAPPHKEVKAAASSDWTVLKKFDFFSSSKQQQQTQTKKSVIDNSPPSSSDGGDCNDYIDINEMMSMQPSSKQRKLNTASDSLPAYSSQQNVSSTSESSNSNNSSMCAMSVVSNNGNSKLNGTTASVFLLPSKNNRSTSPPDYYPSTPESIPDPLAQHQLQTNNAAVAISGIILNPAGYKGANFGMTSLMMFVLGKSRELQDARKQLIANGQDERTIKSIPIHQEFPSLDALIGATHRSGELNAQNGHGETALNIASRCGLSPIVQRLISHADIDLHVYDNWGHNCLHAATASNELLTVKCILNQCSMILHNGENANSASNNPAGLLTGGSFLVDDRYDLANSKTNDELGETPMIIAVRLNLNEVAQALIDYGANVNGADNNGVGPLHMAAAVNNAKGVLLLIQNGANVNMQDNDEKTPLTTALDNMYTLDAVELLMKYDAFVNEEDEVKYNKLKSHATGKRCNESVSTNSKTKSSSGKSAINNANLQPNATNSSSGNKLKSTKSSNNLFVGGTSTKRKFSDIIGNTVISSSSKKANKSSAPSQANSPPSASHTPPTPVYADFRNDQQQIPAVYNNSYFNNGAYANTNSSNTMYNAYSPSFGDSNYNGATSGNGINHLNNFGSSQFNMAYQPSETKETQFIYYQTQQTPHVGNNGGYGNIYWNNTAVSEAAYF